MEYVTIFMAKCQSYGILALLLNSLETVVGSNKNKIASRKVRQLLLFIPKRTGKRRPASRQLHGGAAILWPRLIPVEEAHPAEWRQLCKISAD